MKPTGLFLVLAFAATICRAEKDYPDCEKTYFKSGQLSTKKCFDKDHRFGKAYAYNKKGEVIYERDLRTVAGHASVYFTFHPNGAVKRADWSSAPDAGIQWYHSRDEFSEEGKLTGHTQNNYDDYLQLKVPLIEKDTVIVIKPVKNDTLITNKKKTEAWFVNHTWYPIIVVTTERRNIRSGAFEKKILPGDSIKVVSYNLTVKNNEPFRKYSFELISMDKNDKQQPFVKYISKQVQPSKNVRFYYIVENKSKPD